MSLPLGRPVQSRALARQDLPQTKLPNGLSIRYVSRRDVPFLYREIYEEQNYLSGLSLKRGDTVLDVGANIGLFGLRAAETVGREVTAYKNRHGCLDAADFTALHGWVVPSSRRSENMLECKIERSPDKRL